MKFAIPTANKELCQHFGHCEKFAIIETVDNIITSETWLAPPANHQPGVYPQFLAQHNVDVIIAGGIGQKAIDNFNNNNIEVFAGVNIDSPSNLVVNYLSKQLDGGINKCDH